MTPDAYLLLEDGTRFDGRAVGAPGYITGEVVFTTAWPATRSPSPIHRSPGSS